VKRFAYVLDPLFLVCCALYAANRWLIKPHVHIAFFHNWFNDVLLIPCALPPLLFLHDFLGLRPRGAWPTAGEIAAHWVGWSILFEGIGPHIMRTTGDPWDVVAYAAGAVMAGIWWHFAQRGRVQPGPAKFDRLAPHYRWMEWVLAGPKLQRCRTAFLPAIPAPRNVLLLGEGNGRFLAELMRRHPTARFTCVDASGGMLERARGRLRRNGLEGTNVSFVHADFLDWPAPPEQFDLIVTHFFLDCFTAEQLGRMLPRIAAVSAPGAHWLIADFRQPESGWAHWRAKLIIRSMYLFFQCATRLPAGELEPVDPLLTRHGFALRQRRLAEWGLLHSDWWELAGNAQTNVSPPPRAPNAAFAGAPLAASG
jgi:ubiquinone/menaquinone biosynthesis C-methylase UbiE